MDYRLILFHEGSSSCDQLSFIFIIYLKFVWFHYFLILHILLCDIVCLLHNLVILVILNLIFGAAFMTGLFTCFINVIVYFIYISEHFATIISPKLCVLNLDKFFQPTFDCIYVTCLFQMFHVNMLFINIYLELNIHFNGLLIVHFGIVSDILFISILFTHYFLFHILSS